MSEDTEKRVYIAGPFFNDIELNVVKQIENLLGASNIAYYSPRQEGVLKLMSEKERKERMEAIFRLNCEHMEWCTHCVAVIDNYDTGTVWEMGYLYKSRKKIVTYSYNYYDINVMLNESIIVHCKRLDEVIPAIMGDIQTTKGSDVT